MESNYNGVINLLGGSQTFLGVLTTLVILCIFSNKSNFIHIILTNIISKITSQINFLKTNTRIEEIFKSNNYVTASNYVKRKIKEDSDAKKNQNNRTSEKALINEEALKGVKILEKISSVRDNLQYDFFPTENHIQNGVDVINGSLEQFLAPLYTFFFCITVFIFDELLRHSYIPYKDFILLNLSILTLFSVVFLGLIWFFFLKRTHIDYIISTNKKDIQKYDSYKHSRTFLILKCIIAIVIAFIFTFFVYNYPAILCKLFFVLALISPITLIGYSKLKSHIRHSHYSHLFLFKHYTSIILLTFTTCTIIYITIKLFPEFSVVLYLTPDYFLLKMSIFLLILTNGLILPFIFPYYRYKTYLKYAKSQVYKSNNNAKSVITDLENKLTTFCNDIRKT